MKITLDENQKKVAYHKGSALVLAGAGAGKTSTLAERVRWLESFSPPRSVLVVTFSKKGAGEMRDRIALSEDKVTTGTFHAWSSRFLRWAANQGFAIEGRDKDFTIADDKLQKRIVDSIMEGKEFKGLSGSGDITAKDFLIEYSSRKESGGTNITMETPATQVLADAYEEIMLASNIMDFTDLLRIANIVMKNHPESIPAYRHVVVDEAQDTNKLQFDLLKTLVKHDPVKQTTVPSLFIVGDVDQCIYQWRGAEPKNIMGCQEMGCELFMLEENYRSQPAIVEAANAVIEHNDDRFEKIMRSSKDNFQHIRYAEPRTQDEEAAVIASECKTYLDANPDGEIGVLYRNNRQSRLIEAELMKLDVPYKIRNDLGFMKRKEVMNAMSLLMAVANYKDRQSTIMTLTQCIDGLGLLGATAALKSLETTCTRPPRMPESRFDAISEFVYNLRQMGDMSTADLADHIEESGLLKKLANVQGDTSDQTLNRRESIQELMIALRMYDTLGEFMDNKLLDADAGHEDEGEPRVSLMTIHASKGMEFERIYLIGFTQDIFCSRAREKWEIEETRRLFYVAITRAISQLTITAPEFMQGSRQFPCYMANDIPEHCMPNRPSHVVSSGPGM